MKQVRLFLSLAADYLKANKDELIAKINGFLFVVLVATLIVVWNVRTDTVPAIVDNSVDVEVKSDDFSKLEQVVDQNSGEEVEVNLTSNKTTLKTKVLYHNYDILFNDDEYRKVFNHNEKYNKIVTDKVNTILNLYDAKKINLLLDFVSSNIGDLLYTRSYLNLLTLKSSLEYCLNSNIFNLNTICAVREEVTPFIMARARAPSPITLSVLINHIKIKL